MSQLTSQVVQPVVDACRAGASEAAEALSRALECQVAVSPREAAELNLDELPEAIAGPGLALVLVVDEAAALCLLPEASGLLPSWYAAPDATGRSKLTTLAQELGMLLLPETLMPVDFLAARVEDLAEAIRRGGVSGGAWLLPLDLASGPTTGTMYLIWPAAQPHEVLAGAGKPEADAAPTADEAPKPPPSAAVEALPTAPAVRHAASSAEPPALDRLPAFGRSLLRIRVPVSVTLARKKQHLGQIIRLGQGSIIQFDKSCEETLDLEVGGKRIARGEAVKVGDKFGLRITSMTMPEERFIAVRGRRDRSRS